MVVGIEIVVIAYFYLSERITLKANEHGSEVVKSFGPGYSWWPHESPGVVTPLKVPAAQASLRDGAEVIGVVFQGKARAYQLGVLRGIDQHIVNDQFGDRPLSVLYCDITDCCRVFTGEPGDKPLPINLAGLLNGEMVVDIDGVEYVQSTGDAVKEDSRPAKIPYSTYKYERTTWAKWKQAHPDTDLFAGAPEAEPRPKEARSQPELTKAAK